MDVQTIVLILLAAAVIWLIVELALTVRRARDAVEQARAAVSEARPVIASIGSAVEQAKPAIAHLDEAVAEAKPAIVNIDPLLGRTADAVDALSGDLKRLDTILSDVSRISGKAGNATTAVSDAASSIAGKARSLLDRGAARARQAEPVAVEELPAPVLGQADPAPQPPEPAEPGPAPKVVSAERGYFTYPAP